MINKIDNKNLDHLLNATAYSYRNPLLILVTSMHRISVNIYQQTV